MTAAILLSLTSIALPAADDPTFHESIEPLIQRHCQACHRDGGAAPFALDDFDDAKGWAPQIAEVVALRRMPPWDADRTIGKFANDRSLDDATIDAIVRWAKGGAKEGDPARAPPKKTWPSGWSLQEPPDLVLTTPVVHVPAEGTLPYEYVRLPTNLAKDRWVRAAEIRSESPQVVHHVLVFADGPRKPVATASGAPPRPWRPAFNQLELLQGAPPNERALWAGRFRKLIAHDLRFGEAGGLNGYFISGLAGGTAVQFDPGEGKFLPAGAELTFQIHHQPNGKAADSTTTLALWFCGEPPARTLDTRGVATVVFEIPPGASAHEVVAEYRFPAAATLRSLQPHMHVRGKDFTYFARLPNRNKVEGGEEGEGAEGGDRGSAEEKVLLRVPSFDFNWQEEYLLAEPLRLPAGTVLRAVAHYDNTPANPLNPDPSQPVFFGLQTYEEMMIGYFEVTWDPSELDEGD